MKHFIETSCFTLCCICMFNIALANAVTDVQESDITSDNEFFDAETDNDQGISDNEETLFDSSSLSSIASDATLVNEDVSVTETPLSTILNNNLWVSEESLLSLIKNNQATITVNIFDHVNYAVLIHGILNNILNSKNDIKLDLIQRDASTKLLQNAINSNQKLKTSLNELVSILQQIISSNGTDFYDSLSQLNKVLDLATASKELSEQYPYFIDILTSSKNILNKAFVNHHANQDQQFNEKAKEMNKTRNTERVDPSEKTTRTAKTEPEKIQEKSQKETTKNLQQDNRYKEINISDVDNISDWLKAFDIIPSTKVRLDDSIKDQANETTIQQFIDHTEHVKEPNLLNLIDSNCNLKNVSPAYLRELIGAQYDSTGQIASPNALLGYLDNYVFVLEQLTTNSSETTQLESKKHSLELTVLSNKQKGREAFLKTCLLTIAIMKATDFSNVYAAQYKLIYSKLIQLAKLCKFSKSNKLNLFSKKTKNKVKNSDVSLTKTDITQTTFFTNINTVGMIPITAKKQVVQNDPNPSNNGTFVSLQFTLPYTNVQIIGWEEVIQASLQMANKSSIKDFNQSIGTTFKTINDVDNKSTNYIFFLTKPYVELSNVTYLNHPFYTPYINQLEHQKNDNTKRGWQTFNFVWKYVEPNSTEELEPLPSNKFLIKTKHVSVTTKKLGSGINLTQQNEQEKLVKKPIILEKGKWIFDNITVTNAVNRTKISGNNNKEPITLFECTRTVTSNYSIRSFISQFNELSILSSNKDKVFEYLAESQFSVLCNLLYNIGHLQGNVSLELQDIYNKLIQKKPKQTKQYSNLFKKFIKACESIADINLDAPSEHASTKTEMFADMPYIFSNLSGLNYRQNKSILQSEAFNLLKQILELQYTELCKANLN